MTSNGPPNRRRKTICNSKFICDICQKSYSSKQALNVHSRSHTGDNPFSCDYCEQSFPQHVLLTAHLRSKHKNDASIINAERIVAIICDTCGKSFSSKNALKIHSRSHTKEYPFKCTLCETAFSQRVQLNAHLQRHQGVTFTCDECEKIFNNELALKRHIKKKHNTAVSTSDAKVVAISSPVSVIKVHGKKTDCEVCGKKLSTKSALILHQRLHTLTDRHTCNICGASFAQKIQLKAHSTKHGGTKTFECPTCQKVFATGALLAQHEKTHNKVFRFACEICMKKFTTRALLKRHSMIHDPPPLDVQFKCDICSKTFLYKHVRDDHVKRHLEEKAFKCAQCDKSFVKRFELNSHALTHSEEKRHQCIHCGRCFKRCSVAIVHERIHTGIRPFSCKLCDVKTISFPMLRIHHRRVHPNFNAAVEDAKISKHNLAKLSSPEDASILKRTSKRKGVPVKLNVIDDSETTSTIPVPDTETSETKSTPEPNSTETRIESETGVIPYLVVESPQHHLDTSDMSYIDDLLPFTDGELEAILSEENIDFLKELWMTDSFLHGPVVESDKLFTCEFCERNFEDFEMLVSHLNFEDSTRRCSFAPSYSILSL